MDDKLMPAFGTDMIQMDAMSRHQQVWNLRQQMYAKAGVISSLSFLRIEKTLDSQTSVIEFDLTNANGGAVQRPTERRLKVGDTFSVLGTCIHLGLSGVTAPASISTPEELMQMQLFTYPNDAAFGAASAVNLEALYNGSASLTIDSTVFIDGISVRDFYRVGTAQQGYGVGGVGNIQYSRDSWDFQMYGQKDLIPSIEINGGADVKPLIKLGTSIDLANPVATNQNNVVWWFFGYLNTGAASVQEEWLRSLKDLVPMEDIPSLPIFKSIR